MLGDRVLVKPDTQEEKTKSGLFLPGSVQNEESIIGEVISMGNPKEGYDKDPDLKVGSKVMFIKYAASEIMVNDVKHLIVRFDDLTALLS